MKRMEQLVPHVHGKFRRFSKKYENRARRRLGKKLLDEGPMRLRRLGHAS